MTMEMSVKIFEGAPKVPLGELIELTNNVNSENRYDGSDAMGMTITKDVIPTKANLSGTDLSKFLIVYPEEFVYNPRTHGKKIGLGYNNLNKPFIISWNNASFRVKDKDKLNPFFLYLILSRDEWDREATFRSWGSSTEVFSWNEFRLMLIPLPSIEVQREYVAAYKSLQHLAEQNEALAQPLQKACSSFLSDLKIKYTSQSLGDYIEYCDERNGNKFGLKNLRGVSIEKIFIQTKAAMDGVSLKSYKLIKPNDFCYVPVTSRNGDKITLALNGGNETYICSSAYEVFRVKSEHLILPAFLFLFFKRAEFDRLARYNSWGSARETFAFSDLMRVKIPVPSIEVQRSIVALYHCAEEARAIACEAREQLKKLAPALVQRAANTPVEV